MKITHALVSSDSNPFYLDFWPVVSRVWMTRFDIRPVLCYVAEAGAPEPSREFGDVVRLRPLADIPLHLQAQWARFFQARKFLDETVIISDIDMIPLGTSYFIDQLSEQDENGYLHLNPHGNPGGPLPACYHVARGKVFQQVIETPGAWEDSCREVYRMGSETKIRLPHLGEVEHWFLDELYTTRKIREFPDQSIFRYLPRPPEKISRRIDRSRWSYRIDLLRQGYYFDAHCPRPYRKYRHLIDPLVRNEPLSGRFRAASNLKWVLSWLRVRGHAALSRLRGPESHRSG